MASCGREFGWQEVGAKQVKNMSEVELKGMLESVAWLKVSEEWSKELEKKPKLAMLRKIVECSKESSCADLKSKRERRVMLKYSSFSGGDRQVAGGDES